MRVSVWRQFASNHSANFSLVGAFESAERAEAVAEELRSLIRSIGAWWEGRELAEGEDLLDLHSAMARRDELTPPERAIRERYGLDWASPLDWIFAPEQAEAAVSRYENLVFLAPTGNTWNGAWPFDAILERLGGAVATDREGGEDRTLVMTLRCRAPDAATAQRMLDDVAYLQPPGRAQLMAPNGLFWLYGTVAGDGAVVTFENLELYYYVEERRDPGLRLDAKLRSWPYLSESGRRGTYYIPDQIVTLIEHARSYGCTEIDYRFAERPDP